MQTGVNSSCSPIRIPNKYQVKILKPHKSPCFIIFLGICQSFSHICCIFPTSLRCPLPAALPAAARPHRGKERPEDNGGCCHGGFYGVKNNGHDGNITGIYVLYIANNLFIYIYIYIYIHILICVGIVLNSN